MPYKDKEQSKKYHTEYMKQYRLKESNITYSKEYHSKHKTKRAKLARARDLKVQYNMTLENYNTLLSQQNFCCAICLKHMSEFTKVLGVDHNHDTGEVRGLLCQKCNSALGFFSDDSTIVERAASYLKNAKGLI